MSGMPMGKKQHLSAAKQAVKHMMVASAALVHRLGISLVVLSRHMVRAMERHTIDETSDRFIIGLPELHRKIRGEILRQREGYDSYSYFYGYPYQSLAVLQVFGERGTEERFDAYGLADLIRKEDHVLDIGCNCGFMALYAAFRTGCTADGIDINPYMINIGRHCSEYLQLGDKVGLIAQSFLDYKPERRYSVVLSFATHWTDDKNYRVRLQDHLLRIHAMMADDGLLVFETHSTDVGSAEFYAAMEDMRSHFQWDGKRVIARGTRELYLMRRMGSPAAARPAA